jgi:hypothetical protein
MLSRLHWSHLAAAVGLLLALLTLVLKPLPPAPVQAAPLPQATKPPDVGAASLHAPNIVGGEEAQPGAWPWMASLVVANIDDARSGHFCGGALIHPDWVLTAAHCIYRANGQPLSPANIHVILGRHRLSSSEGRRHSVAQIVPHPEYNPASFDYDVALLRLSTPSTQPTIRLLRSAQSALEAADAPAIVVGWGLTIPNDGASSSDVLHQVGVPLVSYRTCTLSYGLLSDTISPRMVCAGYRAGAHDACQGDSGGPLMVYDGANNEWVQAGVVSWGNGCAEPYYYGVYGRMTHLVSWVDAQLPGLPQPPPAATATPTTPPPPTPTLVPTAPAQPTRQAYLPLVAYDTFLPLSNGDFERGDNRSWRMYALRTTKNIRSQSELGSSVAPRSGRYVAWLGGANFEVSVIEQIVTVPPETPILAFWYQSISTDECGYDFAGVVVNDRAVHRFNLCQPSNTNSWRFATVDLTALAGQDIILQLRAETDRSLVSTFYVDDVTWQAVGAAGETESGRRDE